MLTDAHGCPFTHRLRTGNSPRSGEGDAHKQGEQTSADATGDQPARLQTRDGSEVFALVHEHDREQDQHIDGAHVHEHLGSGNEAGVQQQIQPCHRHENATEKEGGINDVAQQHNTQSTDRDNGGENEETDQLGRRSNGHPAFSSLVGADEEDSPSSAVGLGMAANTCSGNWPARGRSVATPWGSISPAGR